MTKLEWDLASIVTQNKQDKIKYQLKKLFEMKGKPLLKEYFFWNTWYVYHKSCHKMSTLQPILVRLDSLFHSKSFEKSCRELLA